MFVTKRNGSQEKLDLNKLHKVVRDCCAGITGVSESQIEINSHIQFFDGIKTSDIQETLIKSAANLISEETPNYQYVAGRLVNHHLRKSVYGSFDPPPLFVHYRDKLELGKYCSDLLDKYTAEEWDELGRYIKHDRDMLLTYVAMDQFRGKYLVKDRVTGEFYETPQMAFMLIAMMFFMAYPVAQRTSWVKRMYDAISTFDISLPTPIMAGLRTPIKQFSSCVLIDCDDSLDSINATTSAIVKYVSHKAGIGINGGMIRAVDSPIRGGDATHTGVIPFYKMFNAAVNSCSQGGVRKGSATLNYPFWHLEFESLIVLKNNKGTEETRIRGLDYCVQLNRLAYERLLQDGDITLFSPNDVPELVEAFYSSNNEEFKNQYVIAENDPKIRKKTIKASDFFFMLAQERKDTGRIYIMNIDHANSHGSFREDIAPIKMTNLCCEVTLPTSPLNSIFDDSGEIALCTLAAVNWGKIDKPEDFAEPCELIVRALNELLDFQDYPVAAAKRATLARRPLGVGIINLAYWLAKNDLNYQDIDDEGLNKVHEFAEAWSYYLIKASVDLAMSNPAPLYDDTKYGRGIFPIDTYKKDVDDLVKPIYNMNWDQLRNNMLNYGIKNSTLMALMPAETSAQISNATNGIEPPRALVSIKQSKNNLSAQVVPEYKKLKNKYDLLWDQKSPLGYLKICAVLQKFIDQSISVNTSYNPEHYEDNSIPMSVLLEDILFAYKYGLKTLYYNNTNDSAGEQEGLTDLSVSDTEIQEECDSCVI